MKRIVADPNAQDYFDEALQPVRTTAPNFVDIYSNRIPNTYGAPPKQPVAAA